MRLYIWLLLCFEALMHFKMQRELPWIQKRVILQNFQVSHKNVVHKNFIHQISKQLLNTLTSGRIW